MEKIGVTEAVKSVYKEKYGRKISAKNKRYCVRRFGGDCQQFIWWRRGNDCRSSVAKNGGGGKGGARHGDFDYFAHLRLFLFSVFDAGIIRFFCLDPDVAGGDRRGNVGCKIAWKITDENGGVSVLFVAGGGRCVFTVFLKCMGQVCDERDNQKDGSRYAMNTVYFLKP